MTKPTTLVTFLLDKTSSMLGIKDATIEGFNGYLHGLQEEQAADILFTFLQFSSGGIDKLHVATPVADIQPLSHATYRPRGNTPLIEAAVKTIRAVEIALEARSDNPKVVVCIQTDGEENCSGPEYTWALLNAMVTDKQEKGWEFNFMGAGIDAYQQSVRMGIATANTMSYNAADLGSTRSAFAASATNARSFAVGMTANVAYSAVQKRASGDVFDPAVAQPLSDHVIHPAKVVHSSVAVPTNKPVKRAGDAVADLDL